MTYTITEACIGEKDRSCIDVCPVDCIHDDVHADSVEEGASADRILYIDPDECIDCGACEPECPVTAIFPEEDTPEEWHSYVAKNYAYFEFIEGMRDSSGNVLNPVFAGTGGPESFLYYRNNAAGGGAGGSGPSVRNTSSFDIWAYGCLHKPASAGPTDAWEVNNWE